MLSNTISIHRNVSSFFILLLLLFSFGLFSSFVSVYGIVMDCCLHISRVHYYILIWFLFQIKFLKIFFYRHEINDMKMSEQDRRTYESIYSSMCFKYTSIETLNGVWKQKKNIKRWCPLIVCILNILLYFVAMTLISVKNDEVTGWCWWWSRMCFME